MKRELINQNFGINDEVTPNPTYTKKELNILSEERFREKTQLEGEISSLKANEEERVNSIIGHSKEISAPKFNPNR